MYTYAVHQWVDENVNKLIENKMTIKEFLEKCSPNMPEEARQELFYYYLHDYFHDHKSRIAPQWLAKQMERPDGDERRTAFYESIYDAIITDQEDWEQKGADVMNALMQNNATALLIALTGWGAENLARRARMMRGACDYDYEDVQGVLKVDWSDNVRTSAPCMISTEDHEILDFDYSVFEREDDSAATIQKVFVRFATFDNGNEYDFMCVSQAERDVDEDSDVFWYAPKE